VTMLDTYCSQRAPLRGRSSPGYSEILTGVSEHSASTHFGDLSSTELGHHHPFLGQVLCRGHLISKVLGTFRGRSPAS
jgi:hypothetical protein